MYSLNGYTFFAIPPVVGQLLHQKDTCVRAKFRV